MAVKPKYIKDLSEELRRKYPNAFSGDFQDNKEIVSELTNIQSKTVRNRVSGHITRKVNIEQNSDSDG